MPQVFRIEFTETAWEHLERYRPFEANAILDAIKVQLPYRPLEETRNRKPLRDHPLADWELRVRNYRVFYEVDTEQTIVRIVAVGHKEHNRLWVAGEEVEL
jgi:mRNA-degrading endonuclease RelE of RelBE toxin-antitoxin system